MSQSDPSIRAAYEGLKADGLHATDNYPAQFQALDFPRLAGDGEVKMLGNNQAFFFVRNPKGNTDPDCIELDTKNLKTLMQNVRENGTTFHLLLDADIIDNPDRFVEKYHSLRPEKDEALAKAMLGQEAKLIGDFVKGGGVRELAKEVIREQNALPEKAVEMLADRFITDQFHVKGVQVEKALEAAVWAVDAPTGRLTARQQYDRSTENTQRTWLLGVEPEVKALARDHGNASPEAVALASSVAEMEQLPRMDLQPRRGQEKNPGLQR